MRIIDRGEGESIVIDNRIVKVLEINHDRVRIGISSPDEIPPYREETIFLQPAQMELELQAH